VKQVPMSGKRPVTVHATCLIDTKSTEMIISSVLSNIMSRGLESSGVIYLN
jgi:hypothetical protein